MKQRGHQGEDEEILQAIPREHERCSDAEQNDSDIFHTVIREQSLDIVFGQGVQDTQER